MRVLLVEDDLMIGEAIQEALKDASCAADFQPAQHFSVSARNFTAVAACLTPDGTCGVGDGSVVTGRRTANSAPWPGPPL